jgi:hypothetical protein
MKQLTDSCGLLRLLFWRTPHPSLRFVCQRQPGRQYRIGTSAPRRTRSSAVKRGRQRHRKWFRTRRVERLSLLRRAHDYHRDLRTRLPAAAVVYPIDRVRQFMTVTTLSPSLATAPIRRRYLTGSAHASPTATLGTTFGRQNLEHRIPDHRADPIQGTQNRRPAGHSTVVLLRARQVKSSASAKSP